MSLPRPSHASEGRLTNPGQRIDALIAENPGWQGETVAWLRRLIHEADPDVSEDWKWVTPRRPGTPTWEHDGIVCHVNVLKGRVRLTMHEGADLPDPSHLFNVGEGNRRRGIDLYQGDRVDEEALKALIRAGVGHRRARAATRLGERR